MDRRDFLKYSGTLAASLAATSLASEAAPWSRQDRQLYGGKMKGHFTMMQISSAIDTHGNAYLLKTKGGKVIAVDGGFEAETDNVRKILQQYGNHVDMWFLSHPHRDHMGAFNEILSDPQGVTIDKVIYSRVPDAYLDREAQAPYARNFYHTLDSLTKGTDVVNLHTDGQRFDIDGIGIKILRVADPSITTNPYNNQSVIIRFWDDSKSVVLLGDAGIEAGNQVLEKYPRELCCDYLQMAHHGQKGVRESFYKNIDFKHCLFPTPKWLWQAGEAGTAYEANANGYNTHLTRSWIAAKGIPEENLHVAWRDIDWHLA